jgi:hypothetical protein
MSMNFVENNLSLCPIKNSGKNFAHKLGQAGDGLSMTLAPDLGFHLSSQTFTSTREY